MICHRCQGLMYPFELRDWVGGRGRDPWDAWQCIACGEIVDPVIVNNRSLIKGKRTPGHARHLVGLLEDVRAAPSLKSTALPTKRSNL